MLTVLPPPGPARPCHACEGKGLVERRVHGEYEREPCADCGGTGRAGTTPLARFALEQIGRLRAEARGERFSERPAGPSDEEIVKAALQRLILGRELLGYELAAERGLGEAEVHAERLRRALSQAPPLDRECVAQGLARMLGEAAPEDVVDLVAGRAR